MRQRQIHMDRQREKRNRIKERGRRHRQRGKKRDTQR